VRYLGAIVLLLAASCGGRDSPPLTNALDGIVAGGVPGALILQRDRIGIRSAAVGLSDLEANSKMQPDARFRVGSVTKMFVATAVLELVAEKQLRLDEPVARLLPRLLPDGEEITIRDLLAHRKRDLEIGSEKLSFGWLFPPNPRRSQPKERGSGACYARA